MGRRSGVVIGRQSGVTVGRRSATVVAGTFVVLAGLLVHFGLPGPVGDFGADALYAALVYLLVAFAAPRAGIAVTAGSAFALCALIELFQLTGAPAALATSFPPVALLLGTTFGGLDIVAYAAGAAVAAAGDAVARRGSRARP